VSRSLLMRLLESFFRRWWLYLVPVLLLAVVGAATVAGAKGSFKSIGTFNVESSTVLSTLSGNTQNFGFDTPAVATTKRINSMLQTDSFVKDIATKANLDGALTSGQITLGQIRSSLGTAANGANLVQVVASYRDPVVAQQLAKATIDAFVQGVIDSASSQGTAAVTFFSGQLKTDQATVDQARQALDDYQGSHPAPAIGTRPVDEQSQINRLSDAVTQAQAGYNTTLSKSQDAQLTIEQTKADVGNQLSLVDSPALPTAPESKLKSSILSFATFVALGILLSAGAVFVGTLFDHSLRTVGEVRERLGVPALAVVPDVGGRRAHRVRPPKEARHAKEARAPKPQAVPQAQRPVAVQPLAVARSRPLVPKTPAPPKAAAATAKTRTVRRVSGSGQWPG
jgi:uncharacterized protein involved in exopolysaccharide biosynthesis